MSQVPPVPHPVVLSSASEDDEDNEPISNIIKRKYADTKVNGNVPAKKVKVDPQTMEEAVLNLASIPKER